MNAMPTAPSASQADPVQQRRQEFSKGYAAIFGTVLIWSTPSLFMFYLNRFYDPYAQNFYRYSIACLAVLPFAFYPFERKAARLDLSLLLACFLVALPNVVHQITQVMALFYMGPGVYAIFMRSTVIMTAVGALVFFPEERWVIRQWQFQLGTVLGMLGAVGVLWFQPGWEAGHVPLYGVAIAFVSALCWALYGVLVKRPSAALGSVRSFGVISFLTSMLLLPLTLVFGKIATPFQVSSHVNLILVVSAVTCISVAHVLYYVAIRELGVALSQTLQLLCPLFALALSAWLFGERLTLLQLWSAGILLLGAFLAMRVKPIRIAEAAESL
ncbi:MAG: DMT family transporter [Chthoniobacterales bacterium]|nr:DMT family transporter [Chthoniobacterales bacterium]